MSKRRKKLNLIIRGFIYREDWTPLSTRKKRNPLYTIDFRKVAKGYIRLITELSRIYDVTVYITTYTTADSAYRNEIIELLRFNNIRVEAILLSYEEGSSQFTTTIKALKQIDWTDYTLIIRGDMNIKLRLIRELCSFKPKQSYVFVLCQELRSDEDKVIDVLHWIPKLRMAAFYKFIAVRGRTDAHRIHKSISVKKIVPDDAHKCKNTELCNEFFSLYGG